jgi:sugar-phosphatase
LAWTDTLGVDQPANRQEAQVPEVTARALLLDLDGTVVDTTRAVEQSWRAVAAELDVDFDSVRAFLHGIPAERALGRMAPWLDSTQRRRLAERVQAEQADPGTPAPMTPGAAGLLAQLAPHPWAIVTSGNTRLARASMTKAHIPEPAVLVTADDVTAGKPDPEPYLLAAAALLLAPVDCIVVEDAPAGIQAGRAAGMRVVAITTTHPETALTDADWIVSDLSQLSVRAVGAGLALHVAARPASAR